MKHGKLDFGTLIVFGDTRRKRVKLSIPSFPPLSIFVVILYDGES
jgi:hypothetical protein